MVKTSRKYWHKMIEVILGKSHQDERPVTRPPPITETQMNPRAFAADIVKMPMNYTGDPLRYFHYCQLGEAKGAHSSRHLSAELPLLVPYSRYGGFALTLKRARVFKS
jgi:hypothetical protein